MFFHPDTGRVAGGVRAFPQGCMMDVKPTKFYQALPPILVVLAIAVLVLWLRPGTDRGLERRIPGADRPPGFEADAGPKVSPLESATLATFDGRPADLPGAWPQFRGPNRNGIATAPLPEVDGVEVDSMQEMWSVEVGEGFAGPTVQNGRVYLMDYDQEEKRDALRCFSLADGREIWRFSYPISIKRNHGMSRTTPAVTDEYVVAMGPKCQVFCLDARSGEYQWGLDLALDYGTEVPPWYTGQCPLIDGDRVILAPGGTKAMMVALKLDTGEVIWESENSLAWKMTHSSIMPMEVEGRRMYVYCASKGVVGIAADNGQMLWNSTEWKISIATVPSPLPLPDDRIFFCGGYNAGSLMMQIRRAGDTFQPEVLFELKARTFGSTQHTPIFHQNHLFGVRENGGGQFVCLTLEGEPLWESGANHKFGLGPFLLAGDTFFVLDESGKLTLVRASPSGFEPLSSGRLMDGHEAWGPMALTGNYLIFRDLRRLVCLKVADL